MIELTFFLWSQSSKGIPSGERIVNDPSGRIRQPVFEICSSKVRDRRRKFVYQSIRTISNSQQNLSLFLPSFRSDFIFSNDRIQTQLSVWVKCFVSPSNAPLIASLIPIPYTFLEFHPAMPDYATQRRFWRIRSYNVSCSDFCFRFRGIQADKSISVPLAVILYASAHLRHAKAEKFDEILFEDSMLSLGISFTRLWFHETQTVRQMW